MKPLSKAQLRARAPAIFAEIPAPGCSEKYVFISTWRVLQILAEMGWRPVSARQTICVTGDAAFATHLVRLQHPDVPSMRGCLPEVLLTNSHNRLRAFSLQAGLLRFVCANGMTVYESLVPGIAGKHVGDIREQVINNTAKIVDRIPRIANAIDRFSSVKLTLTEQRLFAQSANRLRKSTSGIHPDEINQARRREDCGDDLWSTLNRAQENLMRGGVRAHSSNGRLSRTRPIKSIAADLRINAALWDLADRTADKLEQAA